MSEGKGFSLEEVTDSKTTSTTCLFIIHNKVYDVTNFISEVSKLYCTELCQNDTNYVRSKSLHLFLTNFAIKIW